MLSGRDTLNELNSTLKTARRELERLDRELQASSVSLASNQQQQTQALKRMASMRLDAMRQGRVIDRLDSADYKVSEILEQRQDAIVTLNEQTAQARGALQALEDRRDALHDEVDAAARQLAEREAEVQSTLETDARFQAQLDATQKADAIAVSAAEKAEIVADDRREKGIPFESDSLFMYLWNRGYGTSEYRANPLARLLDAWVARLCRYHDARPNYWMLQEIPRRLREHADSRRTDAEREIERLQAIEEEAAQAGGVHAARAALEDAEQLQDEIDEQIASAEARLRELEVEQSRFAAGDDRYLAECLSLFAETLERRDVADLTRLARATMTPEDDAIVDDIRALRRDDAALRDELDNNRSRHREHLRRVQELEQVRQRFKKNRYDDLRSGFDKGEVVTSMIQEVLRGAIRGGALWNVMRQYQRYRDVGGAWPDFGSGGISRPGRRPPTSRPPTWHWPGRNRSSNRGGFKLPRAPRAPSAPRSKRGRSRGGFRTGGGV
ncbi:MAG: hypothetical protein HKN64_03560 [Woeseiaceae bacterium]|nr:hypothetical protein [Woeseiaceae bacterium]